MLVIVFRKNDNHSIVLLTVNVGWANCFFLKVGYRGGHQDERDIKHTKEKPLKQLKKASVRDDLSLDFWT